MEQLQGFVPFKPLCLEYIQVKVILSTILALILTVQALWLRPMHPSCRTGQSAHAQNKFKERHGSYAERLLLIRYTTIQIGRIWIAMSRMTTNMFETGLSSPQGCEVVSDVTVFTGSIGNWD